MRLVASLLVLLSTVLAPAQDGAILEQKPFELSKELQAEIAADPAAFACLDGVEILDIAYSSDGLRVKGFLLTPKAEGSYPCVIYNRGGNREFGSISEYTVARVLAPLASWGYVVVAGQYRGVAGGEGIEQFGGAEVADILNLVPLLESQEKADASRIGLYGWSRGGMMTYLVLARSDRFKAAAIGGGLSDAFKMIESRPPMEEVFSELVPNYASDKETALRERSAVLWADRLCKSTPILLMHGTADWRVEPQQAFDMAAALYAARHPFRLVMLEGGDHGLTEHRSEVDRLVRDWFDRYVRDSASLPNLEPHGR